MIRPRRFCLLLLIVSGAWSAIHVEIAVAQASGPENPRFEVVLNNVYPPVYPPLARMARIMGDVKIQVRIRRDGSVDSAKVLSGHPMLKEAALLSALVDVRMRNLVVGCVQRRVPRIGAFIHSELHVRHARRSGRPRL